MTKKEISSMIRYLLNHKKNELRTVLQVIATPPNVEEIIRVFKIRVPDDPYLIADRMGLLKSNADKDAFFEKLHTVFERVGTKTGGRKTRQNKRSKNQTRRR